jgi:hypothetical protein
MNSKKEIEEFGHRPSGYTTVCDRFQRIKPPTNGTQLNMSKIEFGDTSKIDNNYRGL